MRSIQLNIVRNESEGRGDVGIMLRLLSLVLTSSLAVAPMASAAERHSVTMAARRDRHRRKR